MDRQRADLPLDPRRLRNDDPNHRRGGYGRDRSPRSRSRIYLISPRGTTVPRQRVRPTLNLLFFLLLLLSPSLPLLHSVLRLPLRARPQPRGSSAASSPPTREIDAMRFSLGPRRLHPSPSAPPIYTYSYASATVPVYRC